MPVYNEIRTIEEIVAQVAAVNVEKEIIIVDDLSTDGTREYLQGLSQGKTALSTKLRVIFHSKNAGKGAALRTGFREAVGRILVIQDADLELDPREYQKLIQPILSNRADVVYGSRFLGRKREEVPSLYFWGNKLLTIASNLATGLWLTDVWTGYKTFKREVLNEIDLQENRFGFEPEFTAKVAAHGWRVCEVPVSYVCRSPKQGKKLSWRDGFRGLGCTLYYGISSRLRFSGKARTLVTQRGDVPVRS
jgi:glycosyltransferase involved in cell wall biosynthesis